MMCCGVARGEVVEKARSPCRAYSVDDDMKEIAHGRYATFDAGRRAAEAIEAEAEDLRQVEDLEKKLKRKQKPSTEASDE